MATFTITAPDGKRYKVTGATKEGALAALKSKLEGPQQPTQPQQQPQVQPQQTLQTPPLEKPPVGNPDASRLGYSLDQAQVMAGKGLEAFGRATGLEGVEQYGTGVVDRNKQQIKDKNYQSTNQGSFLEQEGVGDKIAWTGEKIVENAATATVGLGGAAATSLAAFFGAPLWVTLGLGGTAVAGSAILGSGEVAGEIEDKTGSYDPKLALAAGGVIGLLDRIGATAVIPKDQLLKMGTNQIIDTLVDKGYTGLAKELSTAVTKKAVSEGITEAAQEGTSMSAAAVSGGEYTPKEVANRLVDAAAIGAGQGGATSTVIDSATMAGSLFNNDGTLAEARNLSAQQKGAAGDVARELQQIATAEGFKLSNVDVTAQFGAKGALEAVREQNNGEITELVKALKGKLNSKNASSLDQVISDFAPANAGIKSGKNKVSGYVSKTQMAALARLVGPYQEGAALMNALAKSNVITGLFKGGMKGGVSQFTDYFSPFGTSGAVYDPTRIGNIIVGGGAAAATLGQSVPIQAGIVGLGRLVDAATGRRNKLSRFVNKNVNAQGLPSPSGVSLVDKAKTAESDAKVRREALARIATQIDAPPNANSPVGTILSGTGLSRDGLSQTINSMAQDFAGQPELAPVLESIQQNMDGDTNPVLELNEIIPIIGQYAQMTAPELIVATPDNPLLARGVQQSPTQTDVQTEAPSQPQSGNQFTTPENYQAGKSDNNSFARSLAAQVSEDAGVSVSDKAQLMTALEDVQSSLGPDPVAALDEITTELQNIGVNRDVIDTYFKPYRDRVALQQARVGRMQAPETEDSPRFSMGPQFDYRMQHQPSAPEDGAAPLWDMTGNGEVFPDDIYSQNGLRYYGNPNSQADRESYKIITEVMGNPEAEVTIYRAVPDEADIDTINPGDFVTLSRTYAEQHGESGYGPMGEDRGKILSKKVKVKEVFSEGNDLNEFGYFPETEDSPRFAKVAPVPFNNDRMQQMFGVEDPTPGGNYIDLDTKEDLTGNTYAGGKVSIVDGKPVLDTSDDFSEPATKADGRKVKVNLFKQKAGWKWIDYDGPATIVSTEVGGKHHYALSSDFQNPVTLQTYPNQPSEPRLRPTTQGEVELGNKIGNISVRGKIHPVYDEVRIVSKSPERPQVSTDGPLLSIPEIPRGESTNIQMPNQLGTAFGFAKDSNFAKGRDLKLALQEKSLAAQKEEGVDLTELSTENVSRLADHVVSDALEALKDNSNAIGWYDRTVTDALSSLSEIYPEIQTNPVNKLQFIWALAVTSNGTKVDKNFELAANAYDTLQRTGRFPTNIGIGEAAKAINGGLQQYHTMLEKFERQTNSNEGDHQLLADFMNSQVPVKQIEQEYNVQISGEGKNTLVRGASILGPKIGNGFFSNLYGNFDALTMDRWLMRTVGRMRGSLVKINQPMVKKKNTEIKSLISSADKDTLKSLRSYLKPSGIKIGKTMSQRDINDLAAYIAKQSTSKEWRVGLNGISEDLRKAGNGLAKYLDGQVEAPAGAKERDFIRSVFTEALGRLNSEPTVTRASNAGLTMSDLQALLWYPEKRLYDTAKAPEGQESRGYADDEAPDYANAARKLVETRKAMAVGGGLGSTGAAGPGGRGPVDSDARFNREPTGVAGILAQRIQGSPDGPTARGAVPGVQEVKGHVEHARSLVEIGKPGSQYENGIKDQQMVEHLAEAVGITLKMFDDHNAMLDDGKIGDDFREEGEASSGFYNRKENTARALLPGTEVIATSKIVNSFDSYITALHEVAHGIAGRDIEGNLTGTYDIGKNYLTGRKDAAPVDTLEIMIGGFITMPNAKKRKIVQEIMSLQDDSAYDNGGSNYRPVRPTGPAKLRLAEMKPGLAKNKFRDRIKNFEKYSRSVPEFTVDPLIMYLQDPRKMKSVAPETAKAIRAFFVNSSKIRFYSHPLAMAFAVVMAMLMKQEQAEEEQERQKQQQMAPGALTPPPGALSAA